MQSIHEVFLSELIRRNFTILARTKTGYIEIKSMDDFYAHEKRLDLASAQEVKQELSAKFVADQILLLDCFAMTSFIKKPLSLGEFLTNPLEKIDLANETPRPYGRGVSFIFQIVKQYFLP